MRRFIIEQTNAEMVSRSGLALIGMALNGHSGVPATVGQKIPLRRGIAHSDVRRTYVGLLSLGKSEFEAAENLRDDRFFMGAPGVSKGPSPATLRQRLDERMEAFLPLVVEASVEFLRAVEAKPTPTPTPQPSSHLLLDADVTPFDNANTCKEGVSRTYS